MFGYGPWFWLLVLLVVLFFLWLFWGGQKHEFIGLKPLDPSTRDQYMDSSYGWGNDDSLSYGYDKPEEQVCLPPFEEDRVEEFPMVPVNPASFEPIETYEPTIPASFDEPLISIPPQVPMPKQPVPLKKKKRVSAGERICCRVMEEIFGAPFVNQRPKFLENPETGYNLELDCYNEKLGIAVEYNGIQHYEYPNFTRQSQDEFFQQLRRDLLKVELCDINGVYLIVVPYTVSHDKIPQFIRDKIPSHLIPPPRR